MIGKISSNDWKLGHTSDLVFSGLTAGGALFYFLKTGRF
jgi:hypothetical protein